MNTFEQKYRQNELSPEEFAKWKEEVNAATDEELASSMRNVWIDEDFDLSNIEDIRIIKIKQSIDSIIRKQTSKSLSLSTIWKIAATILLPIFMLSTLYLYKENKKQVAEEMIVSTADGERANITLPDGSQISLNEKSRLCYTPKTFNKENRNIQFDGEGYFKISKDKEHPFSIDAQGLKIKVLGTKFNLLARSMITSAELLLEEGKVSFTSLITHKCVFIKSNQKAILDKTTGMIKIIENTDIQKATAWQRKEMVFRNNSLAYVIKAIEKAYNVQINTTYKDSISDLFTGTIPSSNLNEALQVLEKSYHLKGSIKGNNIILFGEQ